MTNIHLACPACAAVNRVPQQRLADTPYCGKCRQPLLTGAVSPLNQQTFDRFTGSNDLPVVVDFWAGWCGPCQMMAPHFANAAQALKGRMLFAKVDTEAEQAIAARYQIRSIPTLIVFRHGREAGRVAGAMSAAQLQQWLQPYLA